MSSSDSMKSKLAPLGVYTLETRGTVDRELSAYAEGLDPLFDELDEMERESLIPTAEDWGLSEREKFIDREKPQLTPARRRELLIMQEKSASGDASAAGFRQYLSDCGLQSFRVDEFPSRERIAIYINDVLNEGEKTLIGSKIAMAAPVHLSVMVYYQDGDHESY